MSLNQAPVQCCDCNREADLWMCLDCWGRPHLCQTCCRGAYTRTPMHRVQRWKMNRWVEVELWEVGLAVWMGHRGKPCPCASSEPASLRVVHTNGIHMVKAHYCRCRVDAPADHLQLISEGWFPLSYKQVKTVFTLKLLDMFLMENLKSQTAVHKFWTKMRRICCFTAPHSVPVSTWWRVLVLGGWVSLNNIVTGPST